MSVSFKHPRKLRIVIAGNREVGKTCLIRKYCQQKFIAKYLPTIGLDYGIARTSTGETDVRVNIFDLSGNPVFYEIRKEFYSEMNGMLLVFDLSNRNSFEALNTWLSEVKKQLHGSLNMEKIIFLLCGNKNDKNREIEESEGKLWAQLHSFLYYETSALTGDGVCNMFQCLLECIIKLLDDGIQPAIYNITQFNKEQLEAIGRLRWSKNNYEKLGLQEGASKDEINKVYRRLAVLLHPDKSDAPGSEDAFKILVATRLELLRKLSHLQISH